MKKITTLLYLLFLSLSACTHFSESKSAGNSSDNYALQVDYQNAVIDAVIPDKSKIYSGLVQIKDPDRNPEQEWITVNEKKMVLVTSLIKDEYLKYWMKDEPFEIQVDSWVSIPSEWKKFKKEFIPLNDTQNMIRMQQLVGLPFDKHYSVMVEYYADADKIFRPSKDSDASDNVASLEYPIDTKDEYRQWFEKRKVQSYQGPTAYPFTQLGYSYDWNRNSKSHIGVSEFVVPKGTLVKVKTRKDYKEFIKDIQ